MKLQYVSEYDAETLFRYAPFRLASEHIYNHTILVFRCKFNLLLTYRSCVPTLIQIGYYDGDSRTKDDDRSLGKCLKEG